MNIERRTGIFEYGKLMLTGAALAGVLLFTSAPGLKADESACQHRVAKADHRLHEAVEHHGWDSPQAQRAKENLRAERESCYATNHRWWDEDEHRWHEDRDWDAEHGHPH